MARFMWGWVLLGFGVPATFVSLFLFEVAWPFGGELLILLIPLFGAIVNTGLGAWMVSSGAGRWRSDWSTAQRGRMTRFVWGGVLVVLGVPPMVYSLPLLFEVLVLPPPAGALEALPHLLPDLATSLFGVILAGLGAWMLWSGARRRASATHRLPRRKWALPLAAGLLTSVAVAAAWLFAGLCYFSLAFSAAGTEAEEQRLAFLLLGSLFAAPLAGGIVLLMERLRRRQAYPPAGESDAPLGRVFRNGEGGGTMSYVRWFDEVRASDVGLVGGKAANLGEMVAAGLPVPPGFCLCAQAYRDFIRKAQLDDPIRDILAETSQDDPADVEVNSARIRDLFTQHEVPPDIAGQLEDAYHRLARELGKSDVSHVPVAVRSSATAEDLPTASFAGQQDTYLNVCGCDELSECVKRCWASLWTARAVTYRAQQGFDHHKVYLAVVVQCMIDSEISGILFTANPMTGSREEAVINASWGLGEAIVSGLVTPDTFTVRKDDGLIVSRQIASKDRVIEYAREGGTVERETPPEQREIPALSDDQLAELGAMGRRVENHYQTPQDIEWAYAQGRLYLLQSRPITTPLRATFAPDTAAPTEYNRTMFIELFADPLTPFFGSAIQALLHRMLDYTFKTLGLQPPEGKEAVKVFYNQPYFNRDYIAQALEPLPPWIREQMVAQIVNPFTRYEEGPRGSLNLPYLRVAAQFLRFMVTFPNQLPHWVSRYRAEVAEVAALPLDTISDEEIVACIRELIFGTVSRLLNYDFLMISLCNRTYEGLGRLLEPYFEEGTQEMRIKLISGVTGNATMETNKALWDLAQKAKSSPTVSGLLRRCDEGEVRTVLEKAQEGRDFLNELERFLGEYGHREIRMDILYPTWVEDPSPVFSFVRGYLDTDEAHSPHRQQARLAKEREELMQVVKTRLARDLRGRFLVSPAFRWALKHTQIHTRERDTMHFELTRVFPPFRKMLLELGRRWTERGLVAKPEDIFFLSVDEAADLARSPRSMRDLVVERRAEFESNRSRAWPDIIRGGEEFRAEGREAARLEEGQAAGLAASPGLATGLARVIHGPEEFGELQNGEILVAPLTNPVWTPLFAMAGGVVTEVGGMLSHGAIVAREYGIPAVMGVSGATTLVPEYQSITVDGNRGIVYLEAEQGA